MGGGLFTVVKEPNQVVPEEEEFLEGGREIDHRETEDGGDAKDRSGCLIEGRVEGKKVEIQRFY